MGSFAHHLAGSVTVSSACAATAFYSLHRPPEETLCIGLLSLTSGFISDLDSADSDNTHHALNIASSLAPALVLSSVLVGNHAVTDVFLITCSAFLITRVILREIVKHISTPRGMFHSLPAIFICMLAVFLSFGSMEAFSRQLFALAAGIGYTTHLLIDTFVPGKSVSGAEIEMTQHSGAAFKLFSSSLFANFVTYGLLLVLLVLVARDFGYFTL